MMTSFKFCHIRQENLGVLQLQKITLDQLVQRCEEEGSCIGSVDRPAALPAQPSVPALVARELATRAAAAGAPSRGMAGTPPPAPNGSSCAPIDTAPGAGPAGL